MSVSDEQLSQLAIAAQQFPPLTSGRQTALRQLVNGILESGRLCHPQRGQFSGCYEEIYDEAVQDLLLFICKNIEQYKPERASVMGWANMLLERRFFKVAIPKVLGQPSIKRMTIADIDAIAPPEHSPTLTDLLKECIESDPEKLFQKEHLKDCPAANFQVLVLRRLAGKSWEEIAVEFEIKKGTLSSFYSRCSRKFSKKLKEYCVEQSL